MTQEHQRPANPGVRPQPPKARLVAISGVLALGLCTLAGIAAAEPHSHESPSLSHRDPRLATPVQRYQPVERAAHRADIGEIVGHVSYDRYVDELSSLVWAFASRYTLHPEFPSAGVYLRDRFLAAGVPQVSLVPFSYNGGTYHNVVARFPGASGDGRFVIVGGHYDSISESPQTSAPGANDNASGTAALLELAEVFRNSQFDHSIELIAFAAEEQGLHGSKAYVNQLLAAGRGPDLVGVIILDMLTYDEGGPPSVLLESYSEHAGFISDVAALAGPYTGLEVFTSYNPFGSDHMPFLQNDLPAMLLIENDWNRYDRYHRTSDVLDEQDMNTGFEITRLAAAAVATLASPASSTAAVGR